MFVTLEHFVLSEQSASLKHWKAISPVHLLGLSAHAVDSSHSPATQLCDSGQSDVCVHFLVILFFICTLIALHVFSDDGSAPSGQMHLNEPGVLRQLSPGLHGLLEHSSTSTQPISPGMNPAPQRHLLKMHSSVPGQSESLLQPSWQVLSVQMRPSLQFASTKQVVMHRLFLHVSSPAHCLLLSQDASQLPPTQTCPFGHSVRLEQFGEILKQPSTGEGLPENPSGQEHTDACDCTWQIAFGPH